MHEIAKVTLENEMDLILAHKRSMKLAELGGLSLSAQTSFATAVSEVARNTIEGRKKGCLVLCVALEDRARFIVAAIQEADSDSPAGKGLEYAKRLVDKYQVSNKDNQTVIELYHAIAPGFKLSVQKLDEWRGLFRNEPPMSPYDELKRKNEQLRELSGRVQKSEEQYRILTNALPLMIFSLDAAGQLLYANDWLLQYTGETAASLTGNGWNRVVHPDDYAAFALLLQQDVAQGVGAIKMQLRLRHQAGREYLWHQLSLSPFRNEGGVLLYWIGYIVDIHTQKVYEETLKDNIELKQTQAELKQNQVTLEETIGELNRSNQELQQFAYVASHDLQEPIRKILFYSDALASRYGSGLEGQGQVYLKGIHASSLRMRSLIQDLLAFSQINQEQINFRQVDLNAVVQDALQDLELAVEEKGAELRVSALPVIRADERMMRQLFENIVGNSLKYARSSHPPVIEISCTRRDLNYEIAFRDNGIGFDEKYLPRMFSLFQRLHSRDEYGGTGLGLAICQKIVEVHKGSIRAEGKEGAGATFYVTLPVQEVAEAARPASIA